MVHPLITKILEDGLDSVDVSMLSPELRNRLLSDAGSRLLNQNKVFESSEAFSLAGNAEELRKQGDWFLAQQKYAEAALFLRHIANRDELEDLATECLRRNHIASAKAIYESLEETTMVKFIEENFK